MLWRHNHRKCSDGSRNYYMQAIAGPESLFDAPLFPTNSSHQCCYERAGWGGAKTEFSPGRGKPSVRHCLHPVSHFWKGRGTITSSCPRSPTSLFHATHFGIASVQREQCLASARKQKWRLYIDAPCGLWQSTFLFAVNCSVEQKSLHVELNGSGKHD